MALQIFGEWAAGWGGLVILFGSEKVLKSLIMIADLSIFPFNPMNFLLMVFETLLIKHTL